MKFKGTEKWVLGRKKGSYQYISGEHWEDFARVVVKIKGTNYTSSLGEANLKLIIAAPELLEALISVSECLNLYAAQLGMHVEGSTMKSDSDDIYGAITALKRSREVIEKALK